MQNDIKFVQAKYPQASCDRAFGNDENRGFYIWTHPCFDGYGRMLPAPPDVDLLGQGQTPELAWKSAVKNVTAESQPIHPDFK